LRGPDELRHPARDLLARHGAKLGVALDTAPEELCTGVDPERVHDLPQLSAETVALDPQDERRLTRLRQAPVAGEDDAALSARRAEQPVPRDVGSV
jgi:hypothetical protein